MIRDRLGYFINTGDLIVSSVGTVVVVTSVDLGYSGMLVYGISIYGAVDWAIGDRFLWIRGAAFGFTDWEIIGSGVVR